jgi:hypothetical protein
MLSVQGILFVNDKQKIKKFVEQVRNWSLENKKTVRYKKRPRSVVVDLPRYRLGEFRVTPFLEHVPLFLVCEETVDENEATVICGPNGEKLMPFWTARGKVNAKFSRNFDEHVVTIKAKRDEKKGTINIIAHDVSIYRKGQGIFFERKQLFNYPYWSISCHDETDLFHDAIKVSFDKLQDNKKKPCFAEMSQM